MNNAIKPFKNNLYDCARKEIRFNEYKYLKDISQIGTMLMNFNIAKVLYPYQPVYKMLTINGTFDSPTPPRTIVGIENCLLIPAPNRFNYGAIAIDFDNQGPVFLNVRDVEKAAKEYNNENILSNYYYPAQNTILVEQKSVTLGQPEINKLFKHQPAIRTKATYSVTKGKFFDEFVKQIENFNYYGMDVDIEIDTEHFIVKIDDNYSLHTFGEVFEVANNYDPRINYNKQVEGLEPIDLGNFNYIFLIAKANEYGRQLRENDEFKEVELTQEELEWENTLKEKRAQSRARLDQEAKEKEDLKKRRDEQYALEEIRKQCQTCVKQARCPMRFKITSLCPNYERRKLGEPFR